MPRVVAQSIVSVACRWRWGWVLLPELPQAPTGRHADLVTKLAGVAPAERDDAFIHRFGIDAHKEAIALTERHVKEGRDPELRRYAEALLETLRGHMSAARKLAYAAGR